MFSHPSVERMSSGNKFGQFASDLNGSYSCMKEIFFRLSPNEIYNHQSLSRRAVNYCETNRYQAYGSQEFQLPTITVEVWFSHQLREHRQLGETSLILKRRLVRAAFSGHLFSFLKRTWWGWRFQDTNFILKRTW